MRLIDANDLIVEILTHDLVEDDKKVDKIILDAPTVNAIPIEWIREFSKKQKRGNYKDFINFMITYWEKENGRSK